MSQNVANVWICKNCHGVFSRGHGKSECPMFRGGGGCDHVWQDSRQHVLHGAVPGQAQSEWSICRKCKGVFFGGRQGGGSCPLGGRHEGSPGLDFMLYQETSTKPFRGTRNLRWCKNCQGLFLWYPGQSQQGECPAFPGGGGHDGSKSGAYELALADSRIVVVTTDAQGDPVSQKEHGPIRGWSPTSCGDGRILWRGEDGRISLWVVDDDGNQISYKEHGPCIGWTAISYADGRILWRNAEGRISLWKLDQDGNQVSYKEYGPLAGWTALNYSDGRMLWRHLDGRISLWALDQDGNQVSYKEYGPIAGWTALNYADRRILWRGDDGRVSIWLLDAGDNLVRYTEHGPFPSWTAYHYQDRRLYWRCVDGRVSVWYLDDNDQQLSYREYGPLGDGEPLIVERTTADPARSITPEQRKFAVDVGTKVGSTVREAIARATANLVDPAAFPLQDAFEQELSGWLLGLDETRQAKVIAGMTAELAARPIPGVELRGTRPAVRPGPIVKPDVTEIPTPIHMPRDGSPWHGVRFCVDQLQIHQTTGLGILADRIDIAGVAVDPSKYTKAVNAFGNLQIYTESGTAKVHDYCGEMGSGDTWSPKYSGASAWLSFNPWEPTASQPFAKWPRRYTVTLTIVGEAGTSEEVEAIVMKLVEKVAGLASSAVVNGITTGLISLGMSGALMGSAFAGLIGAAVGAAVGFLVGLVRDTFEAKITNTETFSLELPAGPWPGPSGIPPGFQVKPNSDGDVLLGKYFNSSGRTFWQDNSIFAPASGNHATIRGHWEIVLDNGHPMRIDNKWWTDRFNLDAVGPGPSPISPLGYVSSAIALAYSDERLFVLTSDGLLLCRREDDTKVGWTKLGRRAGLRALAAVGRRLYAVTGDGKLLTRPAQPQPGEWTEVGSCDAVALAGREHSDLYALSVDGTVRLTNPSSAPLTWNTVGVFQGTRGLAVATHGSGVGWGLFTLLDDGSSALLFRTGSMLGEELWARPGFSLPGMTALTGTQFAGPAGALYFASEDGVLRKIQTNRVT